MFVCKDYICDMTINSQELYLRYDYILITSVLFVFQFELETISPQIIILINKHDLSHLTITVPRNIEKTARKTCIRADKVNLDLTITYPSNIIK